MTATRFENVPVNRVARASLLRSARLGTRPSPSSPNYGDAARAADAVRAYKAGWEDSTVPPSTTIIAAWGDRKG